MAKLLAGDCPHKPTDGHWRLRNRVPVAWCGECGGLKAVDPEWAAAWGDADLSAAVTGEERTHQYVEIDYSLTYLWRGDTPLEVGEVVLLPENHHSRHDVGPGPWSGVVTNTGASGYRGGYVREVLERA